MRARESESKEGKVRRKLESEGTRGEGGVHSHAVGAFVVGVVVFVDVCWSEGHCLV